MTEPTTTPPSTVQVMTPGSMVIDEVQGPSEVIKTYIASMIEREHEAGVEFLKQRAIAREAEEKVRELSMTVINLSAAITHHLTLLHHDHVNTYALTERRNQLSTQRSEALAADEAAR